MKPNQKILLELLSYDPFTGKLFWKHRPEKYFPTWKSFRQWNGAWAGKEAFTATDAKGYKVGAIFNKLYKAHQIIWCMCFGEWVEQIDHENGFKSDNRLHNLRKCDNFENHKNMGIQKNNKSGAVGVSWTKREKRWKAAITIRGKSICLGYFTDFNHAVIIRKQAEIEHNFHLNHGDRLRNGS